LTAGSYDRPGGKAGREAWEQTPRLKMNTNMVHFYLFVYHQPVKPFVVSLVIGLPE
jgi:hypothetical protein